MLCVTGLHTQGKGWFYERKHSQDTLCEKYNLNTDKRKLSCSVSREYTLKDKGRFCVAGRTFWYIITNCVDSKQSAVFVSLPFLSLVTEFTEWNLQSMAPNM